jgi:superfamily I DNA/RNA helicase/mRNA-degrading endonuclease RelE of RelBE toxin-antitoxin system
MEFRISDTFIDSLSKLTTQEQKAVKTTVFDLQIDPSHPGLKFHKLDRAQDSRFASVRVNRDIRLIVHRSDDNLLICYVAHHDTAYNWAQRRKLEIHPKTGAAQLVEVRETVEEIVIPSYVTEVRQKPQLFTGLSDEELLVYGVPLEWLEDVRTANEDSLLELADHLPAEAAEALLELATGGTPIVAEVTSPVVNPFDHPDALRRFRVMGEAEELERALEYPWDKWTVFLHPKQKQIVTSDYSGPARVSGSAGTGKTIVALHRAVYLAKTNPGTRILLATFSETLANALQTKLRLLLHKQPKLGEQIEVFAMNVIGERLHRLNLSKVQIASEKIIQGFLEEAAEAVDNQRFSIKFLVTEWEQVVDAWQLDNLQAYQTVPRLGRKTRLPVSQRTSLWSIFEQVRADLNAQGLITSASMFGALSRHYTEDASAPFDFIIVDESQDINIAQLRFLAALSGKRPNSLFFAGDLGQRIFQQPFSWKSLGVDVRGRSKTLRINYRTSHQIRMQADKLLGPEVSDVDGITEIRKGTISVFNGSQPIIRDYDTQQEEILAISQWIDTQIEAGIEPEEIGIFVRSNKELARAKAAIEHADQLFKVLDDRVSTVTGYISICTMHLAKGLEFRAVVVMACDDEVIPSQERIELLPDEVDLADLEEVYNTERHLLYVACTRARDKLLVTSVKPASEFLDDMRT